MTSRNTNFRGERRDANDVLIQLAHEFEGGGEGHMALIEADSIAGLSEVNMLRCQLFEGGERWTLQDYGCALGGETGELLDILKKLKRHETGIADKWPEMRSVEALKADAKDEIGDVLTYLDLIATTLGLDLLSCWADKFNKVSDKLHVPYHALLIGEAKAAHTQVTVVPTAKGNKIIAKELEGDSETDVSGGHEGRGDEPGSPNHRAN